MKDFATWMEWMLRLPVPPGAMLLLAPDALVDSVRQRDPDFRHTYDRLRGRVK